MGHLRCDTTFENARRFMEDSMFYIGPMTVETPTQKQIDFWAKGVARNERLFPLIPAWGLSARLRWDNHGNLHEPPIEIREAAVRAALAEEGIVLAN